MWNSQLAKFFWADDPTRVVELRITVEWDETVGSERTLRTGILNPEARSLATNWAHGPFNGPSPIDITVPEPNRTAIGKGIAVDVGTTTEGPSSVALVDHEVQVTLYQRILC